MVIRRNIHFPATISVSGIDKTTYIVTQFVALGVIFLLATVFYIWGHLEQRNRDVVVEVNLAEGGLEGFSGVAGD